jgi:enoyl-CoA hydratase
MTSGTSPSDEVLFVASDGVATITINRPASRNAVNRAVAEAMAAAFDELDRRDDLRVGILTGAGGTFCAGMDLKAFVSGESVSVPGRGFGGLTQRPPVKPLIAAVEGWALAGGFELLLACDLVVAGAGARFGLPEVKRGLVARAGGLVRLPRRVPKALALQMLLTGEPITAERGREAGLINEITEDGGAVSRAQELAKVIAANAPLALAACKQFVEAAEDWTVAEAFARQGSMTDAVFASEDAIEGASAFAEKRPPVWKHR